ncbi:MAG: hydroxyphenylacetyl-CoA thioesterase PaaI [Leucobacter sp.]
MSTEPIRAESTSTEPQSLSQSESQTRDVAVAWNPDPTWAATHMAPTDNTKEFLGISILELERGRAVLSMQVRPEMANGFGITHGGMVFALADTAFAYACNEGDSPAVAAGADVTFTRASHTGDTLTATAVRRWLSGRNGLYDISVTDQHGQVIAEFRGRSFVTNRPLPTAAE